MYYNSKACPPSSQPIAPILFILKKTKNSQNAILTNE